MSIPLSILGRCWREKMISVLSFGHPKSHFSALANGYFFSSKMAHFSYQKMVLRSAETKNRGHFFMPTSPQNDELHVCHLCCVFTAFGWISNQFSNLILF